MLKESRKNKYQDTLEKVIEHIENQGFKEIRADHNNYDKPARLVSQSKDDTFIPDATAKSRLGIIHYFEISKRVKQPRKLINKWKVLEALAGIKSGSLNIFVPHGSMKFTQDLVSQHNIQAELVKI